MAGGDSGRTGRRVVVFGLAGLLAAGPVAAETERLGRFTNLPLPRFVSLRARANIRRGPGTQYRIDWEFHHPGMPLLLVEEFENWRKVVDAEGAGGWIHRIFLRGERTVTVIVDEATLHAAPAPAAPAVARAMRGVIASFRRCEGGWCLVEADDIEGWVPRAALWGVGPKD